MQMPHYPAKVGLLKYTQKLDLFTIHSWAILTHNLLTMAKEVFPVQHPQITLPTRWGPEMKCGTNVIELGRLISSQVQPNISASQKKNVRLIIVGMMNQWDGDDIDSSSKSPSLNERSNKRTNEQSVQPRR